MEIDKSLEWLTHFTEWPNKCTKCRLNAIKRIAKHIPKQTLRKLVDSIWKSKMRYSLLIMLRSQNKCRRKKDTNIKAVQKAKNNVLRVLDNSRIGEKSW